MTNLQTQSHSLPSRLRASLAAALTGLLLAACAGSPTKESTGEWIDDSVITARVKSAMLADKTVSGLDVSVDTFKGRVLLAGYVKSPDERQSAERLARAVPGVKDVSNRIEVR
jgi:hyperosmotically inducible protein